MSHAIALLGAEPLRRRVLWRMRRLTKDRTRNRLASGIGHAIADAEAGTRGVGSAIPVQRQAVLRCRHELQELEDRLRSPRPVYAQGVAMTSALLTDAGSPLYQAGGDLTAAVLTAVAALDGHLG